MNHSMLRMMVVLSLLICHLSSVRIAAQGIPYLRNFTAVEYKGHNMNFDIIAADDGTVYAANFEGLLYYDNAEWRMIHTPGITRITAIFQDSGKRIWTGGYNYFGYLEPDSHGILQMQGCNSSEAFQGEVQWIWERGGEVSFQASDNHVYTVHGSTYVRTADSPAISPDVNQVKELQDGIKAIATNGNGVLFTDSKGKELFRVTEQNGLCSNNVYHIDYNNHGLVWGATDNGLFCIEFPSIYTHFTANEGLRSEVLSLETLRGQIYAGTLSGVYRMEGKTFEPIDDITHACWQLARQGESLLAATSGGVYRITPSSQIANGNSSKHISVEHLTTSSTFSLMTEGNETFYSGEIEGLFINTKGQRKKVSDIEKVVDIVRDKDGAIWIQNLYSKLWRNKGDGNYQPFSMGEADEMATLVDFGDKIIPISTNTTKPFSYPLFSYHDPQGVTWLTDNNGRHLYAYNDDSTHLNSLVYPLMDYSVRSMISTKDLLWIGGDKGLNIVDKRFREISKADKPQLMIRSILLRGDSVIWGGYGPKLEKLQQLASDERHIIFNYATDFPMLLLKTQYRTRINNGQWTAWETATQEEYNNLTYGNFKFEVQARDAFGQLSDIVGMEFSISYPFYLQWYMIVLYILTATLIIYGLLQLRLYKLEKDKHRLEKLVEQRTSQVVRLEKMATVGKLTQGLIDRILNPLNYINNFAKLSEGLVNDARANIEDEQEHITPDNYEDTMEVLDMLKGNLQKVGQHGANTSRMLKAMEEMIKDRSGDLQPINITEILHQSLDIATKYFDKDITQYNIKTTIDIPVQNIIINGNAEQLTKTFTNIIGNAIYAVKKANGKNDSYQPEITVNARQIINNRLVITFRDNGTGIEQTIINKIFDPFFTTKTTAEATGVGLYLCNEIIQNHGGTISVKSEKNDYTEITITLPTLP